jgi:peptidoglycan/LPS O-acetylase OafA/YrhL
MSSTPSTDNNPLVSGHLQALDGWRGISILCVLAAHLLPLGPKAWQLNATAGPVGMALFFTLSGFLITRFLLTHDSVLDFLIRRFFRIIPLAWVAIVVILLMENSNFSTYMSHFLFYANLPPQSLTDVGSHLWSLCLEVQFYVGIALLVAVFGKRGLYALPVLCLAVTLHRVWAHAHIDIVTWRRVDEILAGALLAMALTQQFGQAPLKLLSWLNPYVLLVLLVVTSHPASGFLNYLRPYVAGLLVGASLVNPPARLATLLANRVLSYIAAVSFALYIIHHPLNHTWLGTGSTLERYMKRPLLFAVTFALSHVSTFYFEKYFMALGKKVSAKLRGENATNRPTG